MAQENAALLARHAGTSAADRRARLRAEQFTTLRHSLTGAFAVPLLPDRPRKRSRDAPDGPSADLRADRLHNERADFARSQGNAQSVIAEAKTSDKTFSNLLRKVSETTKCLVNCHAKLSAIDTRSTKKDLADANQAAASAAEALSQTAAEDADMISDASGESIATTSDAPLLTTRT